MSYTTDFDGRPVHELITAIEAFDGSCDPDFDTDLGELERQFAEYRMTIASE